MADRYFNVTYKHKFKSPSNNINPKILTQYAINHEL